jgi:pre-mRNA-processing factor 19
VPDEPVVSKKSGLLFERRLIERYIEVGTSVSDLAVIFLFELGVFFCAMFMWSWPVLMQDHGKCPVTKDDLSMDDIVLVKTNKVWILSYATRLTRASTKLTTAVFP